MIITIDLTEKEYKNLTIALDLSCEIFNDSDDSHNRAIAKSIEKVYKRLIKLAEEQNKKDVQNGIIIYQ